MGRRRRRHRRALASSASCLPYLERILETTYVTTQAVPLQTSSLPVVVLNRSAPFSAAAAAGRVVVVPYPVTSMAVGSTPTAALVRRPNVKSPGAMPLPYVRVPAA